MEWWTSACTHRHAIQEELDATLDVFGMLRRLHNETDALHTVRLARTTEHDVAQLFLGAQRIIAWFGQNLRCQIDVNIGHVILHATLQIQFDA